MSAPRCRWTVNGGSPENSVIAWARRRPADAPGFTKLANWSEADASFRMHFTSVPVSAADCPAAEQLTIGRAGVLSSRAIAAGELETLLRLLGPPSERQRSDLKRLTDVVVVENGALMYWPRTGEQFHIRDAAFAMARVQAHLA